MLAEDRGQVVGESCVSMASIRLLGSRRMLDLNSLVSSAGKRARHRLGSTMRAKSSAPVSSVVTFAPLWQIRFPNRVSPPLLITAIVG
jgi:hypothetical protein